MPIELDLTLYLKETQLQHGLRVADYRRYHQYLTNRLATLRQQVHLSNDKKKFLMKEVTNQNATDPRHIMLLALYAERCWAEAEAMQEMRQAAEESRGEGNRPKGGVPPADQYRKRLNKAAKWSEKLHNIASAVGSKELHSECLAYHHETAGRASTSHRRYAEAKKSFMAARDIYYQLRRAAISSAGKEHQASVMVLKISEMDDRVMYCMQHTGEDPQQYNPPTVAGDYAGTTLTWNGRVLGVASIRVKDALREARSVPVEEAQAKLLETAGPIAVGQSNRVLDLLDRRINSYNDALAHTRQDLRSVPDGSALKTEMQLIVHYFLYQVSQETLRRTFFLAELYTRRFRATEQAISAARAAKSSTPHGAQKPPTQKSKKSGISPTQFASPLEVVRLYEAAANAVAQMELLPGVAGSDEVEEMAAACRAGRLIFTGESWRVSGDTITAGQCYQAAMAILTGSSGDESKKLYALAERAHLEMTAMNQLTSSTCNTPATTPYLSTAQPTCVGVAVNVVPFPLDYQATPCKPVFVDVASTYIDFPCRDAESVASQPAQGTRPSASSQGTAGSSGKKPNTASQESNKKWSWRRLGWGD